MAHRELYTPLGEELFEVFLATYRAVERERPELFRYDLKGQPYNFDYDLFAQRNPLFEQVSAAE